MLILKNTIKKKRVTSTEHKANINAKEEEEIRKVYESQKTEIEALKKRIR